MFININKHQAIRVLRKEIGGYEQLFITPDV